ncbi:MAG TPA: HupE/UreJ family protein [Thermoanaerobaculia bacterium]|nr:HupE/UreJ family protein [Thermoanaerobaculia bacterium]
MIARRLLAVLFLAAGVCLPLFAHELGLIQVEATFQKDGTYVVDLLVDREHLPLQVSGAATSPDVFLRGIESSAVLSFDGKPAGHGKPEVTKVEGKPNVTRLRLTGRTPSEVSRFTFADNAILGYFVLKLRSEGRDGTETQWVDGGKTSPPYPLDRAVVPLTRWQIVKLYLRLGYTHILPRGLDHVLFVLGIFLLAVDLKPVLWQVSAFTLAHTITLALTVYGVVSLSPRVVEPLIALSIVYVAVENVFTSRLHAWRPVVVFCFGLLHGMGFAGVLTEIGLPRSEFVPALLSFNLGVECGQLTVILAAFLAFGLPFRRKPWYRRRIVIPGSLIIAAIGLYWSIQRVFFVQ